MTRSLFRLAKNPVQIGLILPSGLQFGVWWKMDLIAFIIEKGWLGLSFPVGGEEGMHQNFLVQIHKKRADMRSIKQKCNCCLKTAACIGDQLLDFLYWNSYWIIIYWTVNTGLGRPTFWKPVSVEYSWGSGYHRLSMYIDYLNFQPKSSTFSKKLAQKY